MQFINKETNLDKYKTKFIIIPVEIGDRKTIKPIDKMVYGSLRNRLGMSIDNNMFDEKGYFVFYTQSKLASELGVTLRTINTSFTRLKEEKLIDYVDGSTANKIYLCEYDVDAKYLIPKKDNVAPAPEVKIEVDKPTPPVEPIFYDQQPPLSWYAENYSANIAHHQDGYSEIISCYSANIAYDSESFAYGSANIAHNNNIYKNYNKPNNKSIYQSSNKQSITKTELEGVRERYFKQLDMSYLDRLFGHENIVGEVLDLIVDMHIDEYTTISQQEKPREVVRSVLAKLTPCHIEHVINTYNEQHIDIMFPHAYLKTLIYNTGITLKAKTDNKVKADSVKYQSQQKAQNPCAPKTLVDELMECGIM